MMDVPINDQHALTAQVLRGSRQMRAKAWNARRSIAAIRVPVEILRQVQGGASVCLGRHVREWVSTRVRGGVRELYLSSVPGRDGGIIEDAKAHCAVRLGVMAWRPDHSHAVARTSGYDLGHECNHGACSAPSCVE